MSTISTTTHRTASMNTFIALVITLVVILAFVAVSSVVLPKPAIIPVTGNQNAYVDFLRGEKDVFTSSGGLGTSFSVYLAGEKAFYANAVDAGNALWAYRLGEKDAAASVESALFEYRLGEKNIR